MLPTIHVEPTNRCTLFCPRCARTVMNETVGKGKNLFIKDINVDEFDNFIDIELERVLFCGAHGDPIYHNDFINLVKVAKKKAKSVKIITNGSYRSSFWWKQLLECLDSNDEIFFSIDGTPENFTKYRINADWDSIKVGIDACVASRTKVIWKYIVFSFNEDCVQQAKELSKSLGFDEFQIEFSDRWVNNDWLKPNKNYKSKQYLNHDNFKDIIIDPKCKDNEHHYINSLGYYIPCCYLADFRFYYKSSWWNNKEQYDIRTTKLSVQLDNFNKFYSTITDNPPDYCIFNCSKCQQHD